MSRTSNQRRGKAKDGLSQEERARVERAVADYYSSLSDNEVEELSQWGDFAMTQFPLEESHCL